MRRHRLLAIGLRIGYHLRHSLDRAVDVFYWPALDLTLWGLTSLYFTSLSGGAALGVLTMVTAIVLWAVFMRAQYEISGNILEELWNRNLLNLFVSPLSFGEWVSSFLAITFVKGAITFTFGTIVAYTLFRANLLMFRWALPLFAGLLLLNAWALGFLVGGFILRFGTKIQSFAWTFYWVISPFVAIYYPLSVLPAWAQAIGNALPATYVFEAMRTLAKTGQFNGDGLWISLALNLLYLALAAWFLKRSFAARLRQGLVKLQ